MKSRQELITRTLQKLTVVGAGQTASAEDVRLIEDIIQPVMSDLAQRGIFQWGDDDSFDEAAFEHLAGILADAAATDFGKAEDPQRRVFLEGRLRQLESTALSGQRQTAEYF